MNRDYFILFLAGGASGIFILDYLNYNRSYLDPLFCLGVFVCAGVSLMGVGKLVTM